MTTEKQSLTVIFDEYAKITDAMTVIRIEERFVELKFWWQSFTIQIITFDLVRVLL